MPDYKTMYYHLAARVADAVELLVQAQKECEELYVSSPDPDDADHGLYLIDPGAPPKE